MPVTGFDLAFQRPLAGGKSWGHIGPYEELRGTLYFAIDPMHVANHRITDVALAPRDNAGRVTFASDVSIVLPVDRQRGSGRLLLDVVNRGNRVGLPNFNRAPRLFVEADVAVEVPVDLGDGFLMQRGYTVVACGWQVDTPNFPALINMRQGRDVPDRTGRVYVQLQSLQDTHNFLLSDKNHKAYPAHDMNESEAVLSTRTEVLNHFLGNVP